MNWIDGEYTLGENVFVACLALGAIALLTYVAYAPRPPPDQAQQAMDACRTKCYHLGAYEYIYSVGAPAGQTCSCTGITKP